MLRVEVDRMLIAFGAPRSESRLGARDTWFPSASPLRPNLSIFAQALSDKVIDRSDRQNLTGEPTRGYLVSAIVYRRFGMTALLPLSDDDR